jgi:signal transduction histidine kinase
MDEPVIHGLQPIARFRALVAHRLTWKLAVSHLIVTLLSTAIFGLGVWIVLLLMNSGRNGGLAGILMATILVMLAGGIYLFLLAIVGALVSGFAGVRLARHFGRRLEALERATEAIADGHLDYRVEVASRDEIGRLAARFNLLAARLEEIERARASFVSNVSHDLRTPIAIIHGHVEAQLGRADGIAPTLSTEEALRVIERETETLRSLIDDLFTLTRLEEAALPMQPQPTQLTPLIESAVTGIRPLASRQGKIGVNSLAPADLPLVMVDPIRVTQVLNNLLYNALRHTPKGGLIVVEAAPCADGRAVEVRVTDTGAGIPTADLPHIFDRFYQSGPIRHDGSSGLGLAIVKQLVEAQGGAIDVESIEGDGTVIRFTLPRVAARPDRSDWSMLAAGSGAA